MVRSRRFPGALAVVAAASAGAWAAGCTSPTPRPAAEGGASARYSARVERLAALVEKDAQLRADLTVLLAQRGVGFPRPLTLDDTYRALDVMFKPDTLVFTDFMSVSSFLLSLEYTPEGRHVLQSPAVMAWFREFLEARKEFMDSPLSVNLIPILTGDALRYGPLEEFAIPPGGYRSFNAFFTRSLRPGARPVPRRDDPSGISSPVDGRTRVLSQAPGDKPQMVKDGVEFTLAAMLHQSPLAERFKQGTLIGFFLAVGNYHRFHCPVNGKIVERGEPSGTYFNTTQLARMLSEQYRGHYIIDAGERGLVAYVAFGMGVVESVNLPVPVGTTVAQGDELGYFAYGGSYVAVAFEHPVKLEDAVYGKIEASSSWTSGATVKVGTPIGSF